MYSKYTVILLQWYITRSWVKLVSKTRDGLIKAKMRDASTKQPTTNQPTKQGLPKKIVQSMVGFLRALLSKRNF